MKRLSVLLFILWHFPAFVARAQSADVITAHDLPLATGIVHAAPVKTANIARIAPREAGHAGCVRRGQA